MNRTWMGTAVIAATVMLSSCDDIQGLGHASQEFHYSYAFQPGGRLNIDNTNGSVEISGWERNTIEISGTKYAPSEDQLREIQIKVDVSGDSVRIRTDSPKDFFHGGFGAKYIIRAPHRLLLDRAETTNGSLTVEDLDGGGTAKSTNGHVSLARDDGNYDVRTTNGGITLDECSGVERAGTTNGAVRARLKSGSLDAESTNGGIELTILKPENDKPVRASTTNGSITLALAEFHGNSISAHTTNGSITLRLPPDTNAELRAHNTHSGISTDLPLSSTEEMSKHEVRGQLGRGGPEIEASTGGSIHIEKY